MDNIDRNFKTYTTDYEQALRLLDIPKNIPQTLLDAGAGIGRSVVAASRLGQTSLMIYLLDSNYSRNKIMYEKATAHAGDRHIVIPGNYWDLRFPDQSVDFSLLMGPPQTYSPEIKEDTLRNLARVTKNKIGIHDISCPKLPEEIDIVEGAPYQQTRAFRTYSEILEELGWRKLACVPVEGEISLGLVYSVHESPR